MEAWVPNIFRQSIRYGDSKCEVTVYKSDLKYPSSIYYVTSPNPTLLPF